MELDQTQAIFLEEPEEDDGTDELVPDAEKQPKGFIKVLFQKGLTEKSYPVYEGENVIGRNEDTCHVCIPSKSLSKEHACIEIIKDSHLMYDKGSRNKTKRGKMFLTPNVRYELKSDDEICFADIKCIYTKNVDQIFSDGDGSDTEGSESFLLQMEISKEKNNSTLSPAKSSLFAQMNGSNAESPIPKISDNDSPLPPTQTFAREKASKPALCIQETPEKDYNEKISTVVLSESESEDEDKQTSLEKKSRSLPATAVFCGDSDPDSSVDSEKFCIATQAYFSDSNKEKTDDDGDKTPTKRRSNEPTQVFHSEDATQGCLGDEPTQLCSADEPTQVFLQKEGSVDNATVDDQSSSTVLACNAKNKSLEGTQSFEQHSEHSSADKQSDQDDAGLKSTQVFEEDDDNNDEDDAQLFAMATMAPEDVTDDDDNDSDHEENAKDTESSKQSQSGTVPVEDGATVAISSDAASGGVKDAGDEAPTQAVDATLKVVQIANNNNEKVVSHDEESEDRTQAVTETVIVTETMDAKFVAPSISKSGRGRKSKVAKKTAASVKEMATLVIEAVDDGLDSEEAASHKKTTADTMKCEDDEMETQLYAEEDGDAGKGGKHESKSDCDTEGPTQAYADVDDMETQQYGDDAAEAGDADACKKPVHDADEATQVCDSIPEDATQAFDEGGDPEREDSNDATQAVASDEPTQKVAFDETTEKAQLDEPTQKVGFDEPTQHVVMDEPTQKFDFAEADKVQLPTRTDTKRVDHSMSDDDSDLEETLMLKTDVDNQATQVFDMEPPTCPATANEEVKPTMKYDMQPPTAAEEVQPTMAYAMEVEGEGKDVPVDKGTSGKRSKKKAVGVTKSKDQNVKNASKDSTDKEPEAEDVDHTAAGSDNYSYPLSPCVEDIIDTQDNSPDLDPIPDTAEEVRSPPIPLPRHSPLKPSLVDRKRSPSPSPAKRVVFKDTVTEDSEAESKTNTRQRRTRLNKISEKDKKQADAEQQPEPSRASLSSRQRRRRSAKTVEVSEPASAKEALSDEVNTNQTIGTKEKDATEESSTAAPVTASRRGKSKRGAAINKDSEQTETSQANSASTLPTSETETEGGAAVSLVDTEPGRGKRLRGKGKQQKKSLVSSSTAEGPSDANEKNEDIDSAKNETSHIKLSGSKVIPIDEDLNVEDGEADKTDEPAEAVDSTSRRGRRITKTSKFKDFEAAGIKKRESLTKQIKTRTRTPTSSTDLGKTNGDDAEEAKELEKSKAPSLLEHFASSPALRGSRKRKHNEEDTEKQPEAADEPTQKSTRAKRGKKNEKEEDGSDQLESAPDVNLSSQDGKPNRRKGGASSLVVGTKRNSSRGKNDGEDDVGGNVEQKETAPSKKGVGTKRNSSRGKNDCEDDVGGNVEQKETAPSKKGVGTKRNFSRGKNDGEDDVVGNVEQKETVPSNKGPGKRGSQTKVSEKIAAKRGRKTDDAEAGGDDGGGDEPMETATTDKNTKKTGKESQRLSEASATRSKRGAAVTSVDQTDATPSKNARGSSQEPARGKRKKTATVEDHEVSTPPAKVPKTTAMSSPVLRHSTVDSKPKVMFTGVIDEQGEKIVKELGGELITDIQECTHLVTDKIRRTVKFLGGLAKGVLIVSPLWLDNSKRAGTFIDGHKYLVNGPDMEKQYNFSLGKSIAVAKRQPLFDGFRIHVSKSVKPDPNQMRDILQCCGAEVLPKMPSKAADKTVVISCPDDEKLCKGAIKAGIPVVTAEFILTGILRQEVDINAYRLFK